MSEGARARSLGDRPEAGAGAEASAPVLEVSGLTKHYGGVRAVDDLSFALARGQILALVGPNGSGKTTTLECIQGLRSPDSGLIRVLGLDPATSRHALAQCVGVLFQETAYHNRIKLKEALWLHESFFSKSLDGTSLLRRFGLEEKSEVYFSKLSGGQQRRFLLLLAILGNPALLVLDEPTTGLDPQARNNLWEIVHERREGGASILVSTHYLEEAEQHCDVTVIMDSGSLLAVGPPAELLVRYGMEHHVALPSHLGITLDQVHGRPGVGSVQETAGFTYVYGTGPEFLPSMMRLAEEHGGGPELLGIRRAKLEDLFLLLTGRAFREG